MTGKCFVYRTTLSSRFHRGSNGANGEFILIIVRAISLTCFCNSRVLWISFWAEVHYNSIYTADAAF